MLQQYEARGDNLISYLVLVRKAISKFKGFSITQIPRERNTKENQLAHLSFSIKSDLKGIRVEYLLEPSI